MATMRSSSVSRARNTWPNEPMPEFFEQLELAELLRRLAVAPG